MHFSYYIIIIIIILPCTTGVIRELTQQDGWNTQDGIMTKKCRVRLGMHSLAPHFFVILPSRVFQPAWCVSSLMGVCNATRETRESRLFCCKLSLTPIVRANTIFQHIFILILNKKFRQNPKNSSKMKLKLIVPRGQGSSLETLRNRTAGTLRTAKSRKNVARDCTFPHFVIQLS